MLGRFVLVVALLAALFVPLSLSRFVAADEAFYLVAAKQVRQGSLPYRDYFYPQMPLLPLFFAGWHALFGTTWVAARVLAGLLAAGIGGLLFVRLEALLTRRWAAGGVAAFALSGLVIAWYSTAKTFALSVLLLMGAYLALVAARPGGRARPTGGAASALVASGGLLGLAIGVRLLLVVTAVAFLSPLLRSQGRGGRTRALGLFGAGLVVGLLPSLEFLADDPDRFLFNNLGYHLIRRDFEPLDSLRQKLDTVFALVGLRAGPHVRGAQFALLLAAGAAYGFRCWRQRRGPDPALTIAASLLVVNVVPTPTFAQYFSTVVPFLVVCACLFLAGTTRPAGRAGWIAIPVAVVALAAYVGDAVREVHRVTVRGTAMPFVRPEQVDAARIGTVAEISRRIDEVAAAGDRVYSRWPGYLFESHATIQPGMENQFWTRVWYKLSDDERRRYHLPSKKELDEIVDSGEVSVVVLDRVRRRDPAEHLEAVGFERHTELHGVRVYRRKAAAGGSGAEPD